MPIEIRTGETHKPFDTSIVGSLPVGMLLIVVNYPPCGALEIVVLTRTEGPNEGGKPQSSKEQRHGNEQEQTCHAAIFSSPPVLASASFTFDRDDTSTLARPSLNAFAITMTDEVDMATAATRGDAQPIIATGTAKTL